MSYKSYILVFDGSQISRDEVINLIDGLREIVNWTAFLPNAISIVTELSPRDISSIINRKRHEDFRYIITKADERGGWLPKETWKFIREAKPVE